MAQQWPTTAPSVSPGTHDPVATQAYQAGGGDYFRTGEYSHGLFVGAAFGAVTGTVSRMYTRPLLVPVRRSFDRIGVNVTTAATAASGGVLRMGIYSTTNGRAGTLIVDAGTISSESTGGKEIVISTTVDPGLYWLAVAVQVAACGLTAFDANSGHPYAAWSVASSGPPNAVGQNNPYQASVTGALPSTFTASGGSSNVPVVSLRAA